MGKDVKTIAMIALSMGIGYMGYQINEVHQPKKLMDAVPANLQLHLDEMTTLVHDGFSMDRAHYYKDSKRVRNQKVKEDGRVYYFDENGDLYHGDIVIDGVPHSFDDITGAGLDRVWHYADGREYWYQDGERIAYESRPDYVGQWVTDREGNTFWLDAMQNGEKAVNLICYVPYENQYLQGYGRYVCFDENGQYYRGWFQKDGATFYADPNTGSLARGWTYLPDGVHYFDENDCHMLTGFVTLGSYTYYFDKATGAQLRGEATLNVDGTTKKYMFDYMTGAMVGDVKFKNKAMQLFSADTGEWLETKIPSLTYYNQGAHPWGQEVVGDYSNIARTGCGPTSAAMVLSHYGYNLSPYDMAVKMNAWGDYNANYGHGAASTCFTHMANNYGLKIWKCYSVDDMESALKDGAIIVSTINYGSYTHFHVLAGLSKNGMTTCYDPKSGIFQTTCARDWNNQSRVEIDCLDYGPIMAISQ